MKRIAQFIVRYHVALFALFIALACVCAVLMIHVSVNRDMTKYLPADFEMTQGRELMEQHFGESGQFNVMVKGIPEDEREQFADVLADDDSIVSVAYEPGNADYNDGGFALYIVNASIDSYSDAASGILYAIDGKCASRGFECWVDNEGLDSAANGLVPVLVAAVAIAMAILFILATSWIEPVMLLVTILIAVIINMGTNIVFGSVSETTYTIAAVLQMALSMDYLIMLLNRYRREHVEGVEPTLAMERAIEGGMRTIASSSVTTIVGLACLTLMSFTIGRDLGLVLAKGVFLSLVCAFCIMPALVLWLEDVMVRTEKPTPRPAMSSLAAFAYRFRIASVVVFALLLVAGFGLRGLSQASFTTESKNPDRAQILQHFDLDSQIVVLYGADASKTVRGLEDKMASLAGVRTLNSYMTTTGKQRDAADMAEQADMDAALVKLVYYDKFEPDKRLAMPKAELVDYLDGQMAEQLGPDALDERAKEGLASLAKLVDRELDDKVYSCEQAVSALSSHPSVHASTVELIYLAYSSAHAFDPSWTMSIEELMSFMVDDVFEQDTFADVIDDETRAKVSNARSDVDEATANFVADGYERTVLGVSFEPESAQMGELVGALRALLDDAGVSPSCYLVGQGPMVSEMRASFDAEFDFLSIVTVAAILLIVLVTFRSLVIAIILVALIQSAFCWDMVLSAIVGQDIYYIALFCVQSILMGATIDYAILLTSNYRESRMQLDREQALAEALRNSIRTISMSGSILVFVCLVLGLAVEGITGQICLVISEGAAAAVALVLLVLPGTLAALDHFVSLGQANCTR